MLNKFSELIQARLEAQEAELNRLKNEKSMATPKRRREEEFSDNCSSDENESPRGRYNFNQKQSGGSKRKRKSRARPKSAGLGAPISPSTAAVGVHPDNPAYKAMRCADDIS